MRRFIYLFFVVALLGQLASKSTYYIRQKKQQQQTNKNKKENRKFQARRRKIKITAKFRASRRLGFEDTKRIMSP